MSNPTIFTFNEDELRTYIRQIIREQNKTGDETKTINFSVHLAAAFKAASDARFAALVAKSEPAITTNLVETPTEVMKGL